MKTKTLKTYLFRSKPDAIANQADWRKLLKSLLIPPSPQRDWAKNKQGEWERS